LSAGLFANHQQDSGGIFHYAAKAEPAGERDAASHLRGCAGQIDGHHAEAAANVDEAMAAMESRKFDIVFLDYLMPGATGDKVARVMKTKAPEQPIIFVTGYLPRPHSPDVERIIQKPFSVEDIRDAMTEFA